MENQSRVIRVKLEVSYGYPVYFTRAVFSPDNADFLEAVRAKDPYRRHRLFFVIDKTLAAAWPRLRGSIEGYLERHRGQLQPAGEPWVVEGGEMVKNDPAFIVRMLERLNAVKLDRQSFVTVVGGGALQDAAGYAAALAHRGVRLIRVPTTVLAQADSGVGVKNAVNAFGKKNSLGTFAPPFAVLNDGLFLKTLGRRDKINGMAEAVKVALIRDRDYFGWLEENAAPLSACRSSSLDELIRRTAELHLRHIMGSGDPFEFGSARPLDFGHWAAHKLEALSGHRLRHGEAVAIGIALDTAYSVETGLAKRSVLDRVLSLLNNLGLPSWDEALLEPAAGRRPALLDGLDEFREHLGGELSITLIQDVGESMDVHVMDENAVLRSLDRLVAADYPTCAPRRPGDGRAKR